MPNPLVINGDKTVTDNQTGLMWQRHEPLNYMSLSDAENYCENLNLDNYNDWRMPTIQELATLIDYEKYEPAIDKDYFPDTHMWGLYWSSTTIVANNALKWGVNFKKGEHVSITFGTTNARIRAVRSLVVNQLSLSIAADEVSGDAPFTASFTSTVEGGSSPGFCFLGFWGWNQEDR